jgi:RNA polymerase sigma-70 factor (ECF subfamily)
MTEGAVTPDMGHERRQDFSQEMAAQYRGPLIRYFMRHLSSKTEAEDMTQAVFLRVMRRGDVSEIENPEGFLFQTAANLLRDRSRREKTRIVALTEFSEQQKTNEEFSPERVLIGKESLLEALQALKKLGEKTHDIFLLHRLENMKYDEIAELYGISTSAVEKHMIKALAHLVKHMGKK